MSDPPKNPARVAAGRIGAAAKWGRTPDRSAATRPARDGFRAKFEREVRAEFPDATDEQVAAMADARYRAFFLRMNAAKKRKRRTAA